MAALSWAWPGQCGSAAHGANGGWWPVLFEFGECAGVEADGERLAGGERMSGAHLGFQDVFFAAEVQDGDLSRVRGRRFSTGGFRGVLADFPDSLDLLARAERPHIKQAPGWPQSARKCRVGDRRVPIDPGRSLHPCGSAT